MRTAQQPQVPKSQPRFTPSMPTSSRRTSSKMAFDGAMAWTSCPLTVADQIVFGADGIIVTCSFPTMFLTLGTPSMNVGYHSDPRTRPFLPRTDFQTNQNRLHQQFEHRGMIGDPCQQAFLPLDSRWSKSRGERQGRG